MQLRLDDRVVGQLERPLECTLRLEIRRERRRALRGTDEHLARHRADLLGVHVVRSGSVGVEVVGGDDLDDLVLLGAPDGREESRRGEMFRLSPLLGDGVVRDLLHDVLEERVLASLRRARVGLDGEHLLAEERREQRLQLPLRQPGDLGEARFRERLPEHRAVLDESTLLRRQAVEPGGDQGLQRLRDLERLDGTRGLVHVSFPHKQPTVEQHPYRLHGVERDPLGAREDALAQLFGQAGDEPGQQFAHRL